MYKEMSISDGGNKNEFESYSTQNFTRKLESQFGNKLQKKLLDQRRGNFIYSSSLSEDVATAHLYDDPKSYEEDQKLKCAALHLRSLIIQIPKTKTPNPATVQNLKECAPNIPSQLDMFFRTMLDGITTTLNDKTLDAMERKVNAMASDAIFNVTHGTVKPWKHTMMGLGLASLTSKLAVEIINKAGHCISYNETRFGN